MPSGTDRHRTQCPLLARSRRSVSVDEIAGVSALVSWLDNEVPTLDKYATREKGSITRASDRIPMAVRKTSKSLPESELALRAIAMPVFANAHGDIFGGWLLSQMDLAGSAVAVRRANGRVVTVAVTAPYAGSATRHRLMTVRRRLDHRSDRQCLPPHCREGS
jgi:acyl-coenzyme A thioesterase PaaI-like protein